LTEPRRLEVGRIGRAHGLQGELSVTAITNRDERFSPGVTLYLDDRPLVIVSARPHQGKWLVRFDGVTDRTAAEALRGKVLTADALDSAEGELWVHELIGAEVRDRGGTVVGRVASVEANPAHDLLVLESGTLVPIVFVVGRKAGVVTIDPPEGLLEL
jgi:16S rRNA processing protein RimM